MRKMGVMELSFVIVGVLLSGLWSWAILLCLGAFLGVLLRSFGVVRDMDEREEYIDRLATYFSLIVAMLLTMIFFAVYRRPNRDIFYAIILIPLLVRSLIFVIMTYPRESFVSITTKVYGSLLLLFALLSHGFSVDFVVESLPGVVIILMGILATRFKKWAVCFWVFAGIVLYFFMRSPIISVAKVITMVLLIVPLALLGITAFTRSDNVS